MPAFVHRVMSAHLSLSLEVHGYILQVEPGLLLSLEVHCYIFVAEPGLLLSVCA